MKNIKFPNAESLQKEKNEINKNNLRIYENIMNKCIEKILYTNRYTEQTFTVFDVPKILIGNLQYNRMSCIIYIINELEKNNYKCEYIAPSYIYIDWGGNKITSIENKIQSDIQRILKNNPKTSKIEIEIKKSK